MVFVENVLVGQLRADTSREAFSLKRRQKSSGDASRNPREGRGTPA